MEQYISKSAIVAEIERRKYQFVSQAESFHKIGKENEESYYAALASNMNSLSCFLDTLEVKDPYEEVIQYDSVKSGIQAHAETYSFNIESMLFNQLTKEQQALWRKEIEQAVISGGDAGVELARDPRYEENLEVKNTFIEKACEYFRRSLENTKVIDEYRDIVVRGIQASYTSVEEFIEDFKNYMKGE